MKKRVKILLGEDSKADVLMLEKCLRELEDCDIELEVAHDGKLVLEAIRDLKAVGGKVDLIVLDLNMPKVNGHEVLKAIKSDESFKMIPVIILTSSDNENDIKQAYQNHANCYIQKPKDLNGFRSLCKSLESFWIDVVKLPNHQQFQSA